MLDYLDKKEDFDLEGRREALRKDYGADADVDAEIVANSMFEVLSDEKTIKELAEENPSLLKKLLKHIKTFIADIKAIIAQLGNNWAEAKALSKDLQALESIRWLMESALSQIDTTSQTQKNTATGDGVVKYSFNSNQIYPGMSDADRAKVLKNTVISIAQYTGNEDLNGKNVLMLKSTYRKKAREILIELSEKFQIFDSKYSNENIELEFEYSRNSLKESVNKQGDISTDFYDFAKMLYIFDDVIKNAVPIEVHTNKYEGTKRANPNLKYDYVLLSAFSDGEYIIPVEFHIKEFKEKVKEPNKLYVGITLGKIKIENKVIAQVAENYINNNQWQSARLFSKISIPQLIEKINPEYGNFYKYIPSDMLDDEQIKSKKIAVDDEEYKLKVMRDEDVSDILSRKASEKGYDTDTSWRMDHKAPNAKYDVCITDIDRCYGGDGSIYSSKAAYYYGDGRGYDQKAINAIKKARKSPETLISIYRAVPDNIKDTRVRNGDWVSIDKEYAEEHGWRMFDDDYRIIENKVPAKYLFTDGNSIHEFGYDNGNSNEVYKNTENNVKLNEVTYDDKGNLIPLSKRFDEKNPDIRYSYASRKAKNSNLTKYAEAVRLESEGHSSEEIRQQTGWFRGYDNKWRFEIDDSEMKVSVFGKYSRNPDIRRYQELFEDIYFGDELPTVEQMKEFTSLKKTLEGVNKKVKKLGDLIEHNELFAAYPELEDINVSIIDDTGESNAYYNNQTKTIVLNKMLIGWPDNLKKSLTHEIQHAIQHIEGFASGASVEYWNEYLKNVGIQNPIPERVKRLYVNTAGEIEARDAARRVNFDADRRKHTRPDIDREDVVFAEGSNYSFSEDDIERYTEKEYNDYGWVAVNEVLTGNELTKLYSQFADIQENSFKYPVSSANEYMILVGDNYDSYEHLVFIKGTNKHPIITKVIGVYSDVKKYQRNYLDEVIILNEQKVENPFRIIEDYAGEEIFLRYTLQDYNSYNELQRERSGSRGKKNSRGKQSGRRSSAENIKSEIKYSLQSIDEAGKAREKLIRQNKNLRVANMILKQELFQTNGNMLSYEDSLSLAREIKRAFQSSYDSDTLAEEIYNAFKWYDRTDNSYEQICGVVI